MAMDTQPQRLAYPDRPHDVVPTGLEPRGVSVDYNRHAAESQPSRHLRRRPKAFEASTRHGFHYKQAEQNSGRRCGLSTQYQRQTAVYRSDYLSRDYKQAEMEFMKAMQFYNQASGRSFPTWSEVLEVLNALGYEKVGPPSFGLGDTQEGR
jgi:hypothetical protein